MHPSPETIAAKLSRGQKTTLSMLDETPSLLGCSEPYAIRLSKPNSRRPALTRSVPGGDGYRHFALTEAGLAVKAAM